MTRQEGRRPVSDPRLKGRALLNTSLGSARRISWHLFLHFLKILALDDSYSQSYQEKLKYKVPETGN